MNPLNEFRIEKYKETLKQIEKLGKLEYLRELEDKVIQEITRLVREGSSEAKAELQKLEITLNEELDFQPRNHLLVSALKNSIAGALSAAKLHLF